MTATADSGIADLQARLARHPADRYPVQHATAAFHLGVALIAAGRAPSAGEALDRAAALFAEAGLATEAAKATLMQGVARREVGDAASAAEAFRVAAAAFEELGAREELAAARHNLGLVTGDEAAFVAAQEAFLAVGLLGQAGAAARERGALLLRAADLAGASAVLEEAVALAGRAGDLAGLGTAHNVLGLVHLAAARPADAEAAFRAAAGAHPRSVRPQQWAMAKANLALAEEARGHASWARHSARSALGAVADPPVQAQAREILERLGPGADDDLLVVLDLRARDGAEALQPVMREELTRWFSVDDESRSAQVAAVARGLDARPVLAEALVGALLELPPDVLRGVVTALLCAGVSPTGRRRIAQALVVYAVPQWQRLEAILDEVAAEQGLPPWR